MLIEFSVENFLSFKDRVTFSMVASGLSGLESNYVIVNDKKLLKTASIYGANASGKTNLLKVLSCVKRMLKNSNNLDINSKLPIKSFKFDKSSVDDLSIFEIKFIKNNIRYVYGFSANSDKIVEEYLYYYPNGKESIIFDRVDTNKYTYTQSDTKLLKEIENKTADNKFFLATATNWNYDKTKPAYDFLTRNINVCFNINELKNMALNAYKNDKNGKLKEFTLDFLNRADFNINDFEILDFGTSDVFEKLTESSLRRLLSGSRIYQAILKHKINDDVFSIPFDEESLGTQILFILIPFMYDTLNKQKVLFIDELDRSLHPFLIQYIVEIFNNPDNNVNGAQLIFNTHDTNLLNLNLLRRDQIWFTEKNKNNGSSDLYSLNDFSVRKQENIEKGYLVGRYGAIPFITNDINLCQEEKE